MTKIVDLEKRRNAEGLLMPVAELDTPGIEATVDIGVFLDEIEAEAGLKIANVNLYRNGNLLHSINLKDIKNG